MVSREVDSGRNLLSPRSRATHSPAKTHVTKTIDTYSARLGGERVLKSRRSLIYDCSLSLAFSVAIQPQPAQGPPPIPLLARYILHRLHTKQVSRRTSYPKFPARARFVMMACTCLSDLSPIPAAAGQFAEVARDFQLCAMRVRLDKATSGGATASFSTPTDRWLTLRQTP